jgi:drug/metabolite transporter (DMT)-like permease
VIFAAIIGMIAWHHIPDSMAWLGIILIIVGGVLTLMQQAKVAHKSA